MMPTTPGIMPTTPEATSGLMPTTTPVTVVVKDVTAPEALDLVQANQGNPDFVVIDVRTPEEYADGHVEGAVNIDFYSPDFSDEIGKLDRSKTYLVYCRSGSRSAQAVSIMEELEFPNIYHMTGGMLEWTADNLPLVN